MQHIELPDQIYQEAHRRAGEAGFASVDAYIADVLEQDFIDPDDYQHLFTPERLAQIDKAAASIKAGNFYTAEQVREPFDRKRLQQSKEATSD